MSKTKPCDQGNNNVTRIEGDRVFKSTKGLGLERSYSVQVKQWNEFYKDTEYATACVTEKGELSLPYISGSYPTDRQRLACLKDMLEQGYVMTDCRDKRNFITHNGKTYPVDFGQIYHSSDQFYSINKGFHERVITTLTSKIKAASEKYGSAEKYKSLEAHIEELRIYKAKKLTATDPLTEDKSKKIDGFIVDTEKRVAAFKDGQEDAFDDYIETNRDAIKVLNENRVTGAIWKSILLVLCTGIVPGLLGGAVQAIATQGNSFLFFNNQTRSGRMAANIQADVAGLTA
ncbi:MULTISPECIES: hypothetical protein [Legionella]|uniref:Uncharacterized protein n=1 Tax=Legionella feeleii TaxID=453 RepID=A0A0W0U7L3_9GAMM|nr:hypothetical protein [Legionella feeleii]KTD03661.1 hypothetical protein Lfee_0407 [Legionella feeleii]SPX59242.1 Uncharacterised protein [Legionella feeleii]